MNRRIRGTRGSVLHFVSLYSVVSYPLRFSMADGFQKWGFLEEENRTVFYGLGLPHIMRIAGEF